MMEEPLLHHDVVTIETEASSAITVRALVLGGFFAIINSSVNMFFNFRYAGGLGQYWVIIVSYVLLNWWSKIKIPYINEKHIPFTLKEHTLVTVCGAAAAFSQSLGLSGGLAPLTIYYGKTFSLGQLYMWTFIAGSYGVFLGLFLGPLILYSDKFDWPIAKMNAATLQAFHGIAALRASECSPDPRPSDGEQDELQKRASIAAEGKRRALRVFALFAIPFLIWYVLANTVLTFLVTFPVLCWICRSSVCQVLGEGYVGIGIPGLSMGPSILLGLSNSIISLETSIWLAVGAVFSFWILSPALYYSGTTIWPGGLNLYNADGSVIVSGQSVEKPYLSSTMWQNIIGLSFVLIGQLVATVDEFGIPALRYLWGILRSRRNTDQNDIDARKKSNDSRKSHYGTLGKIPIFVPAIALGVLSVALVVVVDVLDLGLPVWGSIFTICFAMLMSLALGMLIGTSGQNMAFPSSLLTQVLFGFMIPGNAPANIAASAINNAICSQSLTLFNDYRTALLCGVRPLDMMAMQLWGTGIGLVCSVLVYDNVMTRWANGSIVFDVGVWANLGASGAHINGEIFGKYGIVSIFRMYPNLFVFFCVSLVIGIAMPLVRRRLPDHWRPYCPDIVLIGISQFVTSSAFGVCSNLGLAFLYQKYLKFKKPAWYTEFQMVSTSGMNMGVGIGGLVLLILSNFSLSKVDLGGPSGDGCHFPLNMAQN